jgi:hypothetical protein
MRVEPPRLLLGLPPLKAEFKGELWWTYLEDDKKQKIKQHRGVGLRIGSFNPGLFARMIAKIAHAFTVADQGLNKFRPLLPSVIVGAQTDNLADFIGGDMNRDTSPASSRGWMGRGRRLCEVRATQ